MKRAPGRAAAAGWAQLAWALAALAACAGGSEAQKAALRADAEAGGPLAPGAALVLVWAESPEEAWQRIVRARTEAPLEESQLLALAFARAAIERVEAAVGGPHPVLNDQVLIDAFLLMPRDRVPNLHVIYVSPEPPGEKLVEIFELRGATWEHRPWTGEAPAR